MAKINGKLKEQAYVGNTTTKRVTLKGDPFEQVSFKLYPAYGDEAPGEAVFYRLDAEFARIGKLRFGDVVDIIYDKKRDKFSCRKISLPGTDAELLLWLFDLPKKWRATTAEEYRDFHSQRMETLCKDAEPPHWQKEYTIAGGKLAFAQKYPDSDPICLTGRILPEFVAEAAREVLGNRELRGLLAYEDIAVRLILQERLGFSQDDFNDLRF